MKTLFVSYDGLAEPLGRSQVLPYVAGLCARGATAAVLSFEKPADLDNREGMAALQRLVSSYGVHWEPLRYHKQPTLPATMFDVAQGIARGAWLAQTMNLTIVHARSYVSALVGLSLQKMLGMRFVFDMRNFWADEKVDAGTWKPQSRIYLAAKAAEREFLLAADEIVVLTERAREEILSFPYVQRKRPLISVIPTCVDLDLFQPRPEGYADKPLTLAYAGSLGGRYLGKQLFAFAEAVRRRRPETRLLLLTRAEESLVEEARQVTGFPREALEVRSATRNEVALALRDCHVGLSFLSDAYSNRSSAPTKLAEYLAVGLPLVVTPGVGDTDEIIQQEGVGVVVRDSIEEAVDQLLRLLDDKRLLQRCRTAAERHFSLHDALDSYEAIWRRLT